MRQLSRQRGFCRLCALLLLLAACSASGPDEAATQAQTGTDESTTAAAGDSATGIPDGMTIPIPDGGDLTASGSDGSYLYVAALYPEDRFDAMVSFYEDWVATDSRTWNSSTGDTSALWQAGSSTVSVQICATGGEGNSSATCVTVNESR